MEEYKEVDDQAYYLYKVVSSQLNFFEQLGLIEHPQPKGLPLESYRIIFIDEIETNE